MREEKLLTEKEYRLLDIDSYSSIKLFLDDRKKYYRKFILKEDMKDDVSDELKFGLLVDCLKFSPSLFEERYTLSTSKVPSGQYGKFVSELWKLTKACINPDGRLSRSIEILMEEAYNNVKYDAQGEIVDFKRDSFDTVKRKFIGTELEAHYKQLRDNYGKTVMELVDLEKAQAVVKELNSNSATRDIMLLKPGEDERYIVYDQFAIIGELNATITKSTSYPLKCLIDRLVIDKQEKSIYIYDLKTCWDNERSFLYSYRKFRYYIQDAVYFYLVVEWKKKNGMEEYAVHFPKFIVAESNNYKAPLIYSTGMDNFNQGMRGFVLDGEYCPGVIRAIQDIMWHKETGIWNISKENHLSGGLVKIPVFQ